jgi:hypothetical protein
MLMKVRRTLRFAITVLTDEHYQFRYTLRPSGQCQFRET